MNVTRVLLVIALLLTCAGRGLRADDAEALPADGAWVRYRTVSKSDDGTIEYTGKLTIKIVGRKLERNGPCRWIELQFVSNEIKPDATSVYKILIPEKALVKESKPWQHAVRGWVKHEPDEPDDPEVSEITPAVLNGGDPDRFIDLSDQMLFWPGVRMGARHLATPVTVEFRQARRTIPEGIEGRSERVFPSLTSDARRVESTQFRMWFHPDVPVGFAFARMQTKSAGGDGPDFPNLTTEYSVEDAGADAKSSLPNND